MNTAQKIAGAEQSAPSPVEILLHGGKQFFSVRLDGTLARIELNGIEPAMTANLVFWGLRSLKDLFYRMPLEKIDVSCSFEPADAEDPVVKSFYTGVFGQIISMLRESNRVIAACAPLKNCAAGFENVLFYFEEGDPRLTGVFAHAKSLKPERVLIKNYRSGWDPIKRCWEKTEPENIADLVKLIYEQRIKKIVGANYYVYERYLPNGIYLPAVLAYLGVEFIGIDYDPIEFFNIWGSTVRKVLHNDGFNRFTLAPTLNKYWDDLESNRNVHYMTVIRHYSVADAPIALDRDYSIAVLSNSRHDMVRASLKGILYLLEQLDDRSLMSDLQMWYLAARRMVLDSGFHDRVKINLCRGLMEVWYGASQLLKYEVIESIRTDRPFRIYGDQGWSSLFPEYYQNRFLTAAEMADLSRRNDVLYLLLNNNFNYLEASGTVFDCISADNAFINFPALFKTEELMGFSLVEYDSEPELNRLINNASKVYEEPRLQASIRELKNLYVENENAVLDVILSTEEKRYRPGKFGLQLEAHAALTDKAVQAYLSKHGNRISAALQCFCSSPFDFDVKQSRFAGRKYFKTLSEPV